MEFSDYLQKRGLSPESVEFWGIYPGAPGMMEGRLCIPIYDVGGEKVSEIGRSMDGGGAKYLNFSFPKSAHLFGLYQNKRAIFRQGIAILTEGALDVILAWQYGIGIGVSALGTALSRKQILLLSRYTDRVILAPDSDPAGGAARRRWRFQLEDQGFTVHDLLVQGDLDSWTRKGRLSPDVVSWLDAVGRG